MLIFKGKAAVKHLNEHVTNVGSFFFSLTLTNRLISNGRYQTNETLAHKQQLMVKRKRLILFCVITYVS